MTSKGLESPRQRPFPYPFLIVLGIVLKIERIPWSDRAFCVCFPLYLWAANTLRFGNNRLAIQANKIQAELQLESQQEKAQGFFVAYVASFALLGIVGPFALLGYIWWTPEDYQTNNELRQVATMAAPHLTILLVQIVMEHTSRMLRMHAYIQCLNPIGFNVYREFTLATWVSSAWDLWHTQHPDSPVAQAGLALAVLNAVLWTYNCFIFLFMRN